MLKSKQNIIFLLVFVVIGIGIGVWYFFSYAKPVPVRYENFSFLVPRGWIEQLDTVKLQRIGVNAIKFYRNEPFASFVVQINPLEQEKADLSVTQKKLRESKQKTIKDFQEVETHLGTFAGQEALFYSYRFTFVGKIRGTYPAQIDDVILVKDKKVYYISLFAPVDGYEKVRKETDIFWQSFAFQ